LLRVFFRDEGTGPHTIDLSRRKAYTALTFASRWKTSGEAAKAWGSTLGSPMPNIEGTAGVAGGVPIKAGSETIGAIGVSGAGGGDRDEACAIFGISKVADKLKGRKAASGQLQEGCGKHAQFKNIWAARLVRGPYRVRGVDPGRPGHDG